MTTNEIKDQVRAAYEQKEAEYPVMAGIYRFSSGEGHSAHLDREGLVGWARERFGTDLDIESLRSKQREEIRAILVEHSREAQQKAETAIAEVRQRLDRMFGEAEAGRTARAAAGPNGRTGQPPPQACDRPHIGSGADSADEGQRDRSPRSPR